MEIGSGPLATSSTRCIKYRRSEWKVHDFEVWSGGGCVCRCAALRVQDSVLVWVGAARGPALGAVALAMPPPAAGATLLLDAPDSAALPLSRRLAARLRRPVYVCCGATFDRFTLPLLEQALLAEINNRPDCF